ncbi:hypothetical protein [Paenibacillus sp. 2TAB23]|uniref:hypothetical protein n=1 Tax=Paenibacillus sp. 2TAB23 TaxID=3233004 RepID=UPI003F9E086D
MKRPFGGYSVKRSFRIFLFIGAVLLIGESFCWVSVAAAPLIELGFVLIGFYFIDETFGAFQYFSLLGCNCDIYYPPLE